MVTKKIKYYGDGSWIENGIETSYKEADVIVMPGGGDWNPALYGHKPKGTRYWHDETDKKQMALIDKAIADGKFVFGICRGLQAVTIKNGGFLIQDVSHPSKHIVKTFEGTEYSMNSCHHQMCYPYELSIENYEVLSWTKELSNHYTADKELKFPRTALDEDGDFKEPEMIWYPKTRCLGVQGHPFLTIGGE